MFVQTVEAKRHVLDTSCKANLAVCVQFNKEAHTPYAFRKNVGEPDLDPDFRPSSAPRAETCWKLTESLSVIV